MISPFHQPISQFIWENKYRYQLNGKVMEHTIEDTWWRTATHVASVEKKQKKYWQSQFYHLLADFNFLPGGRILAGAGTQHQVTLFNCFVMGTLEDSLNGIFKGLREGALTLQEGGGVGYDFSTLRPKGSYAHASGAIASGPVSFMRIWDSMSATMQSTGARRGAMMGVLRCDHPDIEEFIATKSKQHELRHFNVSVLITDEFMNAVKHNLAWPLVFPLINDKDKQEIIKRRWSGSAALQACCVYKVVNAKQLWEKIIRAAYDYSEPGVIFEDTINQYNNLWYHEWISATNPCGEIPLPSYGACNLGSINLTQFIINPYSLTAAFDWHKFNQVIPIAIRFLDNVIDVSKYPLPAQKKEALLTRRIGLGITGLADIFVMLGLAYGNKKSLNLTEKIMATLSLLAWETSILLAKEKGSFPLFEPKKYSKGLFVQTLPQTLKKQIKQGMRNSHHTAIAPTGTISLLANNVSSGIEPIFQAQYHRRIRKSDGDLQIFAVTDYAYQLWLKQHAGHTLPTGWVDAQALRPEMHLKILQTVQPYIDNAISKTIFIPADFPFEALRNIYTKAHQLKLKGCTIYRPTEMRGSVLSTDLTDEEKERCCII